MCLIFTLKGGSILFICKKCIISNQINQSVIYNQFDSVYGNYLVSLLHIFKPFDGHSSVYETHLYAAGFDNDIGDQVPLAGGDLYDIISLK